MDIALARPSDATAIAELSRDAIEHGLAWRWRPSRVARCIAAPDTNVAVARDNAHLAGFGLMQYAEDTAHLLLLAVTAAHRRRGIATGLVTWLEKSALTAGIGEVQVEVRVSNRYAQRLYGKLGYRTMGRLRGYYQGHEDALRLQKDLWCPISVDP